MTGAADRQHPIPTYAWLVFALTFGLLISDYMARQVLNAVFPLLKAEWALSDGQLGLLSGAVALMVGLLTVPLSLLADRWGRVRSLTAMAIVWSLATLLCAVAQNYGQMLAGRLMVGVGEAAYGSVGIAVVVSVFPQRLRTSPGLICPDLGGRPYPTSWFPGMARLLVFFFAIIASMNHVLIMLA